MDFVTVVDQAIALLRQRGRVTYRTLKRQFQLDDTALEDLTVELIKGQRLAADEDGEVLVWIGDSLAAPTPAAAASTPAPSGYTPSYLAEKILTSRRALEGERKQVTVLFADLKDSTAHRGTRPGSCPTAPGPRPASDDGRGAPLRRAR